MKRKERDKRSFSYDFEHIYIHELNGAVEDVSP